MGREGLECETLKDQYEKRLGRDLFVVYTRSLLFLVTDKSFAIYKTTQFLE